MTKEPVSELDIPQIVHPDPFLAFMELVDVFFPEPSLERGIHPLAHVSDSARVEENVAVLPFAYIGDEAVVGAGTVIHTGVLRRGEGRARRALHALAQRHRARRLPTRPTRHPPTRVRYRRGRLRLRAA